MAKPEYYQEHKEAVKAKAREYYHANKEKTLANVHKYREENREEIKEKGREYYRRKLKNRLFNAARSRSKSHGYEFNIDLDDLIIPEVCPLLGIRMEVNKRGSTKATSFSLDRIDSSKGYVKGNVWIISMLANSMKSSSTFEQFQMMAKKWTEWKDKNYDLSECKQRENEYNEEVL